MTAESKTLLAALARRQEQKPRKPDGDKTATRTDKSNERRPPGALGTRKDPKPEPIRTRARGESTTEGFYQPEDPLTEARSETPDEPGRARDPEPDETKQRGETPDEPRRFFARNR